jgi:nucleotide-binding universal stress UspA family protein
MEQFARTEVSSIGDATEGLLNSILREAATRAEAGGSRNVRAVIRSGSCAEELIALARETGARALFVRRRGAGGRLHEALIGSVSQKLAGISPIMPVIVP